MAGSSKVRTHMRVSVTVTALTTLSVLVSLPKLSLQQQCSSAGDLARTECVLITRPSYDSHQWATCVTEDFIIDACVWWKVAMC